MGQVWHDVLADTAAGDQLHAGQDPRQPPAPHYEHGPGLDTVQGLAPGAVLTNSLLGVEGDKSLVAVEMTAVAGPDDVLTAGRDGLGAGDVARVRPGVDEAL